MAIPTIARPKDKTLLDNNGRLKLEWDAYFSRLESTVALVVASSGVISFEGRSGLVVSANGDYTASEITNVPVGTIAATDVQTALNELDSEKLLGTTGGVDNVILRSDGTGGKTVQATGVVIDDSNNITGVTSLMGTPFSSSVQATGLNGIESDQFFIFKEYTTAPGGAGHPSSELAVLRVQRSANYSGGTPGSVESSLWVPVTVASNVANFEWAILGQLTNNATAGENVAGYFQAIKASTGPTWAAVMEAIDSTASANPTTGLSTVEIDVKANGTDNNLQRLAIDIVAANYNAGTAPTIGYGIRVGPQDQNAANGSFTNGIYLTETFVRGIDLSTANCSVADIVTKGSVGFGTATPDRRLHSEVADAVTNTTTYVTRLTHITSGTAATSFGVGLEAELENASGTNKVIGALDWAFTDATNATEDAELLVKLMTAGAAAATVARFTSTGRLGLGVNVTPAVALDIAGTGDTQIRAVDGGSVDLRMNSSVGSNVGFVGTFSNHDIVFTANSNNAWRLATGGSFKGNNPTGGLGYATGAGGTVSQATSKATGVTLNTICGQITMNNAALAAGTTAGIGIVSFTLTNSAIAAADVLLLNHISGGQIGAYTINAQSASGSATITVRNNTAGILSDAIVIAFVVIKAVTS